MLEVTDLRVAYGQIEAVKGVSFRVPEGSIVTLVGANGAGKTTTLAAISGLLRFNTFYSQRVDLVPGMSPATMAFM